MTAPRSDHLLTAFLEEGLNELPDRAYDAVRFDIHRTRQRVVIGPWRTPSIFTVNRFAVAAALVAAVGLAWANLGPPLGGFGRPPTPAPTALPAPTAQPISGINRSLEPGRYWFDYDDRSDTSIHITVPAPGWTSFANFAVDRNYGITDDLAGPSFVVWNLTPPPHPRRVRASTSCSRPWPGRMGSMQARSPTSRSMGIRARSSS
jgi:hypothetical protein